MLKRKSEEQKTNIIKKIIIDGNAKDPRTINNSEKKDENIIEEIKSTNIYYKKRIDYFEHLYLFAYNNLHIINFSKYKIPEKLLKIRMNDFMKKFLHLFKKTTVINSLKNENGNVITEGNIGYILYKIYTSMAYELENERSEIVAICNYNNVLNEIKDYKYFFKDMSKIIKQNLNYEDYKKKCNNNLFI